MAHKIADTIVALASGAGRAAVAVIRISGPRTRAVLEAIMRWRPAPSPPRCLAQAVRSARRRADRPRARAVVSGPSSFTGEDMAELQVHGSRAVVQSLIDAVLSLPAACGSPSLASLRGGRSRTASSISPRSKVSPILCKPRPRRSGAKRSRNPKARSGGFMKLARRAAQGAGADRGGARLRRRGRRRDRRERAKSDAIVADLLAAIAAHLADRRGERLRDGVCVVIAGPPNVGKSSLLNALARRDVAIVSEEAGTTRDVIEVHLDLGGIPVILSDTAGIREAEGRVEAAGIGRALARVEDADIVLWLADATDPARTPIRRFGATKNKDAPTSAVEIAVMNKLDLAREAAAALPEGALAISAKTGEGLDLLMARLETEAEIRGRAGDRRAADDPGAPSDRARSRKGRARPL